MAKKIVLMLVFHPTEGTFINFPHILKMDDDGQDNDTDHDGGGDDDCGTCPLSMSVWTTVAFPRGGRGRSRSKRVLLSQRARGLGADD